MKPEDMETHLNEDPMDQTNDPDDLNGETQSAKLTEWKKEPTINFLKEDLEYARQDTKDQENNVKGWLDLRNTTGPEGPRKSKQPGRSSIQPKLIRKHNEWRYPPLTEPFLNTERMFQVTPRTGEDKAKADQNQIVLNWQFDTKINKVEFIDKYVRTCVDEGTVVVRVGWEQKTLKVGTQVPQYEYYPVQDQQQAEGLMMAMQLLQTDPDQFATLPDDLQASAEFTVENGVEAIAKKVGETTVMEERVTVNRPALSIVNISNLFVDPSCEGDWDKAKFMVHTYESTESDLRARNMYQNLDQVNWASASITSNQGNQDHESQSPQMDARTASSKKGNVLVYEYWGLFDVHDNGMMIPILVTWVGDTIIQMQENPYPDQKSPFVIVSYMPILKSAFGEADASLLQDNQRIIGAVTRGQIDLLGRSANAQSGFAKGFLDSTNRRRFVAGQDFEYNPNGDPKAAIQQMTYPEIPRSAHETIMMQNQEAEALTGVKSFSGGMTGEAYGKVATGIRGAMDAAATREMSILRRLAQGVKQIGEKIIAMNALYLDEKEIIRVTNDEYVEVTREELEGNFDLKVDISTANVDEQRSQDLGFMLQTMGPDMDPGLSKIILGEIADLKRMPHLAQQIRDYEPQPDPLQVEQQQLTVALLRAQVAAEEAKTLKLEAEAAAIFNDVDNDASGLNHERNIEAMGAQARGNRDLEVNKALLSGETPAGNIEAAVGFNALVEAKDERETAPKAPNAGSGLSDPEMAPIPNGPQPF